MCCRATRVIHGTMEEGGTAMWTDYCVKGEVRLADRVDGGLEEFGVRERVTPKATDKSQVSDARQQSH
jgi:hypothetical protein